MSNKYLLKINSISLGDTLAATPTLRKLYNSYDKKIDVVTHYVELFKNNKYVDKVFSFSESINENYYKEIFNTFLGVDIEKNNFGTQKKHNAIDIRQFHAIDLGFMLHENEMEYDYEPDPFVEIKDLPNDYVCFNVSNTWASRTYSNKNWQELINLLNKKNIPVVLIGKDSSEVKFLKIDSSIKKLNLEIGIDLTNKLNISQCWHVINRAKYFITMDSGLLHLAGTTDVEIIQLGSSINNKLRAPYRNRSQNYKYKYVAGSCDIFCASDIKYGVKEWKTIHGVPPLISCLENKIHFECHPNPYEVLKYINYTPSKYLFITPHLSTGGAPKYLEWLIEKKKKENSIIKVIEWNLYSTEYTVQRKNIINSVGNQNFLTVGNYWDSNEEFEKKQIIAMKLIKEFNPDFIHLNENSEAFAIKGMSKEFLDFLYKKDRNYKIYECSHYLHTDFNSKKYIPDEYWVCSKYHSDKINNLNKRIIEYELSQKNRPDRNSAIISLGLDPNYFHVLQVGLFNKNKNQAYTFDIAKKLIDKPVLFHFIGNDCYIDECSVDKNQTNCRIWGERSDIDLFMSCMDLFVMPSHEELNPIALKEAISWNMTCFVSELQSIKDQYKNNKNVEFINKNNLYDFIAEKVSSKNQSIKDLDIFTGYNLITENDKIICTFFPTPKIEILGIENVVYNIKFIDETTNIIHYETNINTNMWAGCGIEYFCKWKIVVTNTLYRTEKIFKIDLKDKLVKIINESSSLGDTIAWMSAVDEFQKLHNCKVDYYTCKKDLFSSEYKNINFYDYAAQIEKNYYAQYKIGCFSIKSESNLIKTDWRISNLQKIAFETLGLPYSEKKSKIQIPNKYILKYKYVCIATQSTSQSRYWNCNGGWEKTIEYIKAKGYKVICVDKHFSFGSSENINICPKNIDYFAGERPFEDIIDIINNCEFFIGLSSGLSWLAWALNKKIVKINGSVDSAFEFYTPYAVENKNVCNSCFNSLKHNFDPSNWKWCPENKNYECSRSITDLDVIRKINMLLQDSNITMNNL